MATPISSENVRRADRWVNYGKGTEIYKFEKIKRAKTGRRPRRFSQPLVGGLRDWRKRLHGTGQRAAARMVEEINQPVNRGYADNGIAAYKEAVARFMKRKFGVELDPVSEVNHCIGSKTALAMIPACFINPGDVTLMTVPGYPVAGTHTRYYGGTVYRLPLLAENDFFPDLKGIPSRHRGSRPRLLVINYPNSPTGKVTTRAFFTNR